MMAQQADSITSSTGTNTMPIANYGLATQHDAEDLEAIASEPSPPLTPESKTSVNPSQSAPDADADQDLPLRAFAQVRFNSQTPIPVPRESLHDMSITAIPSNPDPDTIEARTLRRQAWRRAIDTSYRYSRIDADHVRLLYIKRGAVADQLNVTLLAVARNRLGNRPGSKCQYIALSYHWGGGSADQVVYVQPEWNSEGVGRLEDVVTQVHQGKAKRLSVRSNLYDALKHLRRANEEVTVWVDALCINQADPREKSEQISQMPNIYRGAYNVCIWLGSDSGAGSVSAMAMNFIPLVIDLDKRHDLLNYEKYVPCWASLFELLKWSWFSRRWIIQEVALARTATVHCGNNPEISWYDFQDAIAIFCQEFATLRPKLMSHFAVKYPHQRRWCDESDFEIEQLGAKILVDITADLFRENKNDDGVLESTYSLETLVCQLHSFDTSDPRDTINALINISSEYHRNKPGSALALPVPDYNKPLLQVYRHFVEWVVIRSKSLDIICRYWALPDGEQEPPFPSWIKSAKESAFGTGSEVFEGRKAGESFVGLPGKNCYHASGRDGEQKRATVDWSTGTPPEAGHAIQEFYGMSITVTGLAIGTVSFCTESFPDGTITKACLQGLGWSFVQNQTAVAKVPTKLWQTLVANRGPRGTAAPPLYRRSCQYVMANLTRNGHIQIDSLLRSSVSKYVKDYLERVRVVTSNRLFINAKGLSSARNVLPLSEDGANDLVGLAPADTQPSDIVAILYGCSVPVILHPVYEADVLVGHQLVGEAFIYGKMDGEALSGEHEEVKFRLI
ncbi:hypothetical protein J4E80_010850 [Alternaria sp. BMP 0032]|nr:hypothetical protein J4E80_010850 [Alternaria sp. BMP 0032]